MTLKDIHLKNYAFIVFSAQKIKELKLQIDCETKRYTDLTYCLKNEQQRFKNTRRSRMLLDTIKHVLGVFFNSFKDPCLFRDFDSKRDMNALRVSCRTQLFQHSVDDKLTLERTGYQSNELFN